MFEHLHKDPADEKEFILLLKQGDENAYRALILQFRSRLMGVAYGITLDKEESMDIVQEVFLRVFKSIHAFRGEARLATWLYRITVNQCLSWRRKWKRKYRWHKPDHDGKDMDSFPEPVENGNHPEALYQNQEHHRLLVDSLNRLPEEARAVFVLKEWEGMSYEEISKVLKIKKGTVSSRLFYVRQRLKEALYKYLNEGETK